MTTAWEPTLPILPYPDGPEQRSSGWSGSDTSHERAQAEDASGTTSERQQRVLLWLAARREEGSTWREVSTYFQWHHGQASGTLSVLHKGGHIARLADVRRQKCAVYVLPQYVDGRPTAEQGRRADTRKPAQREEWRVRQGDLIDPGPYANREEAAYVAHYHGGVVQHRFVTDWEDVP